MNFRHYAADSVMYQWIEQVQRRQRGEASGLRAIAIALTGSVSACCGVTPVSTKAGNTRCPECGKVCELRVWVDPGAVTRKEADWTLMHVRDKHIVNADREDYARAAETDRILRLSKAIEPWPRGVRPAGVLSWHHCLAAWGVVLMQGGIRAEAEDEEPRFWLLAREGFGPVETWTTRSHRESVRYARETVGLRLQRGRMAA